MSRVGARRDDGFTLVELLAYLTVFISLTGTIVGAEVFARKLNRSESATLEAMYEADRLFAALAEDCDRATRVHFAADRTGDLVLQFGDAGGATYAMREGEVVRDGKRLSRGTVEFSRPGADKHPRLVKARLAFKRAWGPNEWFERAYERTFLVRNLGGDGRGGL